MVGDADQERNVQTLDFNLSSLPMYGTSHDAISFPVGMDYTPMSWLETQNLPLFSSLQQHYPAQSSAFGTANNNLTFSDNFMVYSSMPKEDSGTDAYRWFS